MRIEQGFVNTRNIQSRLKLGYLRESLQHWAKTLRSRRSGLQTYIKACSHLNWYLNKHRKALTWSRFQDWRAAARELAVSRLSNKSELEMRFQLVALRQKQNMLEAWSAWKNIAKTASIHKTVMRSEKKYNKTLHALGAMGVRRFFKSLRQQMISEAFGRWVLVLLDDVQSGARTTAELLYVLNSEYRALKSELTDKEEESVEYSAELAKLHSQLIQVNSENKSAFEMKQELENKLNQCENQRVSSAKKLQRQMQDLQAELDAVLAQKVRLESRMVTEKSSEAMLREECESYKRQLLMLQGEYDTLIRASQGGNQTVQSLEQLHEQDRAEKQRLRDELEKSRERLSRSREGSREISREVSREVSDSTRTAKRRQVQLEESLRQVTDEIEKVENTLASVSEKLEKQLEMIREEGAEPDLLKDAKKTMARGNELTVRLERLNAQKTREEDERNGLLGLPLSQSRSPAPLIRSRSNTPKRRFETFDLIDVNGDGVIDKDEFLAWQARQPRA